MKCRVMCLHATIYFNQCAIRVCVGMKGNHVKTIDCDKLRMHYGKQERPGLIQSLGRNRQAYTPVEINHYVELEPLAKQTNCVQYTLC